MSKIRHLTLIVSGMMLRLCLFFGFTSFAIVMLFGDSNSIKQILHENNTYSRFLTAVIETGKEESLRDPTDIPFDDPEIQKIIRSSFNEQALQNDSEVIIDSLYRWLKGNSSGPDFQIDLEDNKQALAKGLSEYAINRVAELPVCRSIPDVANIYKIDCFPEYIDLEVQKKLVYESVLNDRSLIKENVLSFDSLTKSQQDSSQNYYKAPKYFKWFVLSPWLFLVASFFLIILIISQNRTHRLGLKQISSALMTTGVALAIAPLIASFITPTISKSIQDSLSGEPHSVTSIVNDIYLSIYRDLNQSLLIIALLVFLAGLAIRLTLKVTRPKTPYKGVKNKTGLSSSIGNFPKDKVLNDSEVPIQSSERKIKGRKPRSVKSKYRKL